MRLAALTLLILLAACSDDSITNHDALVSQVHDAQVGFAADQWIEMKNNAGKWERTGLIFGYLDDYDECTKAVAGLKAANFEREYRCVPAN